MKVFGKQQVSLDCPSCKRKLKVSLVEISKQVTITYRYCWQKIALQDKSGGTKNVIGQLDKLNNLFK